MGRRDGAAGAGVCMAGDTGRAVALEEKAEESLWPELANEWKLGWSEEQQNVFATRVWCKQLCNSNLLNTVL